MNSCEDYIKTWPQLQDFSLGLFKLDWSPKRKCSRGGIYSQSPGINIAMHIATREHSSVARLYEYASFNDDPEIGGFYYTNADLKLGLHICHEMAHAVQYYRNLKGVGLKYDRPHGQSFKEPYRLIRKKVLNPFLEPQEQLKKEYLILINNLK